MQTESLFSETPVNTGRQLEIDIAKSVAILAMVFVHVLLFFPNSVLPESIYAVVVNLFGDTPAAPVFMFCMGVGLVYSRHSDAAGLFRRGIWLLFVGYLLNLLRMTLPLLLFSRWVDPTLSILHGLAPNKIAVLGFFAVDILQFAGLAFLFFAIVRYFNLSMAWLAIFTLAFSAIQLALPQHGTESLIVNSLIGLFHRVDMTSAFPFLSWIQFPVAGYLFGWVLQRCRNKTSLYGFLLLAGSLVLASLTLFSLRYGVTLGIFDEGIYYSHDFFQGLWSISFVLAWLGLLYFLSLFVKEGILLDTIKRWSRNVNGIYIVHWIMLTWLLLGYSCMGLPKLNTPALAAVTLAILFASDFLVSFYSSYKNKA